MSKVAATVPIQIKWHAVMPTGQLLDSENLKTRMKWGLMAVGNSLTIKIQNIKGQENTKLKEIP